MAKRRFARQCQHNRTIPRQLKTVRTVMLYKGNYIHITLANGKPVDKAKSVESNPMLPITTAPVKPPTEPPLEERPTTQSPSDMPVSRWWRFWGYFAKVAVTVFATGSTLLFLLALWDSYRPKITTFCRVRKVYNSLYKNPFCFKQLIDGAFSYLTTRAFRSLRNLCNPHRRSFRSTILTDTSLPSNIASSFRLINSLFIYNNSC